ncbi:MAG: murein L,D-transpeptidase family protein [Prosthecobacter sp.]|nr:murein L,D-transpeptidase family protein [Prosthecobacter sp.]
MKGKLALLALLAIGLTWMSLKDSPRCSICISNVESMFFPPTLSPLPYPAPPSPEEWRIKSADDRLANVRSRLLPRLCEELENRQLKLGSAAFIRAFKESRELELWLRDGADWTLFRTYPISALSGGLGPKLAEGDGQTPEGFYAVAAGALNPASSYHLAFNIGYPNACDLQQQRTGSLIMIHGSNVSVGCLAMSDPYIEEIYWIVAEALQAGQGAVPVHLFPFRMTEERMAAAVGSDHLPFWQNLKPVYDRFDTQRRVPAVEVVDGRYQIGSDT